MSEWLSYFQAREQEMIDLLTALVGFETPTLEKSHVDALGAFMEQHFHAYGASSVTRFPMTRVGDCLLARWNESRPGRPIMFLVHIDTVWPIGTLAQRPVTIDDQRRLFGPGAVDMKGGITIVLSTLKALHERGELPERPIWVLMTTDEETGSIDTHDALMQTAADAGLVLVMEPATVNDELKTMRKGIATYRLDIQGKPAHAGNAPEKGLNAIMEFAQQAVDVAGWNDYKNGRSVSVTMVNGGSATNVIPEFVTGFVDTRSITVQQWEETDQRMMALAPKIAGVKLTVSRHNGHKPMERDEKMQLNFAQVKRIGETIGLTVRENMSGGASDGNTVAAMGISVIDGMGPQGDGLHALEEHIVIASMPRRCALIAAMLQEWQFVD